MYKETLISLATYKNLEKELLALKEKAEQNNRLRQAFITNISTEIYGPMNRIAGYCQLLNQPDLPGDTKLDYMEYINKSCSYLHELISDILDISRIDAEKSYLQNNEICIPELLKETLIVWTQEADKKDIDIRMTHEDLHEDLTVISDESKLTRIIFNLIDIAISYTLDGNIEFGCQKKDSNLEFYVRDTGISMSSSLYNAISEIFSPTDSKATNYYSGKGLSLAISKYYINLLGGSLRIESIPGEFNAFYFTIPFIDSLSTNEEIITTDITDSFDDIKTCLVVDDLEINYLNLKALLSGLGFTVLWARDGDEAIYMSIIEAVDIVLVDLNISDSNGCDAVKIIKRKRPDLLVFAYTVAGNEEAREKAIEAGFDDLITKPAGKEDFLNKLDSVLNLNKIMS